MSVEIPPSGTRGGKRAPSGAVGRALMSVVRRVHRLTGSKSSGRPLLYLTPVGAKSGQPRTAVVVPFPEGDDPDQVEVQVEGRKTAVTPQTLTGENRATAWERITRERPNFADYEQKTDRVIPVVRLTAR